MAWEDSRDMAIETLGSALRQITRLFSDGTVTGLSDAQLLERFVAHRDATAFEALMARHGMMVLSVCRGVLNDPNDAEDAFQATFLILVKKAGTFRGHAALGGWLYVVAHRVAIRANAAAARRRLSEMQAGEMAAATSALGPTARDEQLRALHEEIARLPEKFRLAILLCDLQGLPQDQAAMELRLSERTLRRRLSGGRERLKARLGRRGLSQEGAAMGALFLREARAGVSAAWGAATVRAALAMVNHSLTAGTISTGALQLTREVLRIMLLHNLRLVSVVLLGAGLMAWGASAALVSPREMPPPDKAAISTPPVQPEAETAVPQPDRDPLDAVGMFPVRGRVLDPEGKPVANAEIYVWHVRFDVMESATSHTAASHQSDRVAATDPQGRFRFELDKSASDFPYRDFPAWHGARIAAVAPGYGPACLIAGSLPKGGDAALRLVPDDVPIRGRILDSQGQPVEGVKVHAREICVANPGVDNDALLATGAIDGTLTSSGHDGPTWLGRDGMWTTDADGRFEVRGVGRDQIVGLEFRSPKLEKVYLYAMARLSRTPPKPRQRPSRPAGMRNVGQPPPSPLVGANFEHLAGPTKPITGIVRLKGAGKPLAGVHLLGVEPATRTEVSAMTGADGRFSLVGLPKAGSYNVRAAPRPGLDPFLHIDDVTVTDTEGLKPIETVLELPIGVIVTGRLIDTSTGHAVRAKHVFHTKLPTNRSEGRAGLSHSGLIDPVFRITVPPGEGMIYANVRGLDSLYTRARLRPSDKGKGIGGLGDGEPRMIPLEAYHAYRIIDVPVDADSFAVDLELTRGIARKGRLVGPDSKPVIGAQFYGATAAWGQVTTLVDDSFEVYGLDRGEQRLVLFAQKDLQLVGSAVIGEGDMKTDAPLLVRLDRAGSIRGRLIDDDGLPLAGARLSIRTIGLEGMNLPPGPGRLWPDDESFTTDTDGRFQIDGVKPGIKSNIGVRIGTRANHRPDTGGALRDLILQHPGEVRDLGDVTVKEARTP